MDQKDIEKISKKTGESDNSYLFRICSMKENGLLNITWTETASILNESLRKDNDILDESTWRKRYTKLKKAFAVPSSKNIVAEDWIQSKEKEAYFELEKQKIKFRDENTSLTRTLRTDARFETLIELLRSEIKTVERCESKYIEPENNEKSICAMLSDIHYGLSFSNIAGKYNCDIAKERLTKYANAICEEGRKNECCDCYLTLMGDLISGSIHNTIKIENRINVVKQVIGVSELITEFIKTLSMNFRDVYINYTSGNHSRIDQSFEDSLRDERLDALIPWYCMAALEPIDNVIFKRNEYDSTIATFNIYDKLYISTHGDIDKDYKTSCTRLEQILGKRPDVFLTAHMHIPEIKFDNIDFVRNGCVCGSGDEYTMRKRLYGPPCQVFMVVDKNGINSLHPVRL